MTILSQQPDGMGFYYGFLMGYALQVNVRKEGQEWIAYVGGERVGAYMTKNAAEAGAVAELKAGAE